MNTVNVTLNFMGGSVDKEFAEKIKSGDVDDADSHSCTLAETVLGLPLNSVPDEVLDRYAKLSTKELYVPFLPHTEKIFERLLLPFKSAKRCFCLGEFLAAIELCAHIAEMLAQLVWEMESIFNDEEEMVDELEKSYFGSRFEKLGQERRVRILRASRRISHSQADAFTELRTTRRKYFHLWSESVAEAEQDAEKCFVNANTLIQEILQISISNEEPGKVSVNPRLSRYLERVRAQDEQR